MFSGDRETELFLSYFRLRRVEEAKGNGGGEAGGDQPSAHGAAPGVRVLHRLQPSLGCVSKLGAEKCFTFRLGFRSLNLVLFLLFIGCPGEAIILAFQHYILALGTAVMIPAVLVPMMGGDDVSSPPASFVSVLAWY